MHCVFVRKYREELMVYTSYSVVSALGSLQQERLGKWLHNYSKDVL